MSEAFQNPFRPNTEIYSVLSCSMSAIGLLFVPISLAVKLPCMGLLAAVAAYRLFGASNNQAFKQNLRRLPFYTLKAEEIPYSKLALFLGIGFKWDQRHTQRLFLARLPENQKYLTPSYLYQYLRKLEIKSNGEAPLARFAKRYHICPPLPPVGGFPEIHGIEPNEDEVWSDIGERVGHMLVLGTTRVGKTRLAETLITQDIRRGDVVIVFDPKGDEELLKRMYAESKRANRAFFVFHLGYPEHSCRYNPIGSYARITEVATRIANQLPGEGQSAAFKEFVWRFINVIAKAMAYLGIKPTYKTIYTAASNIDKLARDFMEKWLDAHDISWREDINNAEGDFTFDKKQADQAVKSGRDPEVMRISAYLRSKNFTHLNKDAKDHLGTADGLATILSNDRSYFEKLVSSLYPLLEKLTTGQVGDLISPEADNLSDTRPIFEWANILQNQAVVYVGLDSLSDFEVAGAVGNAMFADLTSLAGQIYKHGHGQGQTQAGQKVKVCIHADEFNELIGDEFIPMLNKAGGAGYQVTVYTQTWSDVEAKIGSAAKAAQIGGNLNSLIMLRVKAKETAEILTNQLPEVSILTTTLVSGANDVSDPADFTDFSSKNEDRVSSQAVPMLQVADLVGLPKGQAFALLEGGRLWKIRLPLATPENDEHMPANIAAISDYIKGIRSRKRSEQENENDLTIEGESHYGW